MKDSAVLLWVERGLLAVGVGLGVWCAAVMMEARSVARMPVPDPPAVGDVASLPMTAPAAGSWVAKLDAPSVRLSATVLEGTDDATLDRGAGHIEDTPFPGQPGNIGIAGHRDTTFRPVRHLRTGDPLEITTREGVYRYLITKTFIVDPKDVWVLDPGDQPMLTLVTCYPFEFIGNAPRRYIIQAVLIDQTARVEPAKAGGAGLAGAAREGMLESAGR
jgi:LPXTG-site transpeptidase (sortase) family protein